LIVKDDLSSHFEEDNGIHNYGSSKQNAFHAKEFMPPDMSKANLTP